MTIAELKSIKIPKAIRHNKEYAITDVDLEFNQVKIVNNKHLPRWVSIKDVKIKEDENLCI
jgi:hypothetical protein